MVQEFPSVSLDFTISSLTVVRRCFYLTSITLVLLLRLYERYISSVCCQRPYHVESTGSRPITEVKQRRARLVLGWVTAWEHPVLLAFFFFSLSLFSNLRCRGSPWMQIYVVVFCFCFLKGVGGREWWSFILFFFKEKINNNNNNTKKARHLMFSHSHFILLFHVKFSGCCWQPFIFSYLFLFCSPLYWFGLLVASTNSMIISSLC